MVEASIAIMQKAMIISVYSCDHDEGKSVTDNILMLLTMMVMVMMVNVTMVTMVMMMMMMVMVVMMVAGMFVGPASHHITCLASYSSPLTAISY